MPISTSLFRRLFLAGFLAVVLGIAIFMNATKSTSRALAAGARDDKSSSSSQDYCYQGDDQGFYTQQAPFSNVINPNTGTVVGSWCQLNSSPQCANNSIHGANPPTGGCGFGTHMVDTGAPCQLWCDSNLFSGTMPPAAGSDVYGCSGVVQYCYPDVINSSASSSASSVNTIGAIACPDNAICTAHTGFPPHGYGFLHGSPYQSYQGYQCPAGTRSTPLHQQVGGEELPVGCGVGNSWGSCVQCDPITASSSGGSSSSIGVNVCQRSTQCSDGIDNDGDYLTNPNVYPSEHLIDQDDPGCWIDPTDPQTYDPMLNNEARATTQCQDTIDNDGDGVYDQFDPGCWTNPLDSNSYDPSLMDESAATNECHDGIDNDGDGLKDEQDPGCGYPTSTTESDYGPPECSDGSDNDGDGLVDSADPGCHTDNNALNAASYNPSDRVELAAASQCDDGIDNDGDGLIDNGPAGGGFGGDPGCANGGTVEADHPPHGQVLNTPVCKQILGWACDPDVPSNALQIKVKLAGLAFQVGSNITASETGEERLKLYCNNTSNHHFTFNVPSAYQTSSTALDVYAINQGAGADTLLGTVTTDCNFAKPQCSDGIDNDGNGVMDYPADHGCTSALDDDEWSQCTGAANPLQCDMTNNSQYYDVASFNYFPNGTPIPDNTPIHTQYEVAGLRLDATCIVNGQYVSNEQCMGVRTLQNANGNVLMVPPGGAGTTSLLHMHFINPLSGVTALMGLASFDVGLISGNESLVITAAGPSYGYRETIGNNLWAWWATNHGNPSAASGTYITGETIPVSMSGALTNITIQSSYSPPSSSSSSSQMNSSSSNSSSPAAPDLPPDIPPDQASGGLDGGTDGG